MSSIPTNPSGSPQETPTIELFMHSINQEFPSGVNHGTFRKADLDPSQSTERTQLEATTASVVSHDYVAVSNDTMFDSGNVGQLQAGPEDWRNQWIQNWSKTTIVDTVPSRNDRSPLRNVQIRQEDFGGLIFDRDWDRVFKVNQSGYDLFERLLVAYRSGNLSTFIQTTRGNDTNFVDYLQRSGILGVQ